MQNRTEYKFNFKVQEFAKKLKAKGRNKIKNGVLENMLKTNFFEEGNAYSRLDHGSTGFKYNGEKDGLEQIRKDVVERSYHVHGIPGLDFITREATHEQIKRRITLVFGEMAYKFTHAVTQGLGLPLGYLQNYVFNSENYVAKQYLKEFNNFYVKDNKIYFEGSGEYLPLTDMISGKIKYLYAPLRVQYVLEEKINPYYTNNGLVNNNEIIPKTIYGFRLDEVSTGLLETKSVFFDGDPIGRQVLEKRLEIGTFLFNTEEKMRKAGEDEATIHAALAAAKALALDPKIENISNDYIKMICAFNYQEGNIIQPVSPRQEIKVVPPLVEDGSDSESLDQDDAFLRISRDTENSNNEGSVSEVSNNNNNQAEEVLTEERDDAAKELIAEEAKDDNASNLIVEEEVKIEATKLIVEEKDLSIEISNRESENVIEAINDENIVIAKNRTSLDMLISQINKSLVEEDLEKPRNELEQDLKIAEIMQYIQLLPRSNEDEIKVRMSADQTLGHILNFDSTKRIEAINLMHKAIQPNPTVDDLQQFADLGKSWMKVPTSRKVAGALLLFVGALAILAGILLITPAAAVVATAVGITYAVGASTAAIAGGCSAAAGVASLVGSGFCLFRKQPTAESSALKTFKDSLKPSQVAAPSLGN